MKWRVWVSVVGLGILGSACGGPQLGRIGPPVLLPNGTPRNACEREEWLELAPARLNVVLPAGTVSYFQLHEGAGVFQTGEDQPTPLEDLWPKLQEPQLMRKHQARIEPTDAKSRHAAYWFLGGLVGLGAGVGTGVAVRDDSKSTSDALIGVGIGLGSVGLLMELLTMPSPEEQLAANARRRLFKPREDDLMAVARGVDRANANRRRQCGGNPVPFAARVFVPEEARPPATSADPAAVAPASAAPIVVPPSATNSAPDGNVP